MLALACSSYDASRLSDPGKGDDAPTAGSGAGGTASAGSGGRAGSSGHAGNGAGGGSGAQAAADAQVPGADGGPLGGAGEPVDAAADASDAIDAGCGPLDGSEDCCPDDDAKLEPGQCGCGVADTDGDTDATADCVDGCPDDDKKTAPGICGCGRLDSDQGSVTSCAGLVSALVNRYRFDGSGTAITDSRSGADGVAINATLAGTGQLDLAGGTSDAYVDLPNGVLSRLTDATIETWVTWGGGTTAWQRIFDFGDNNDATEGNQGTAGVSYLFLTPRTSGSSATMRVAFSTSGSASETRVNSSAPLASGMHHVAVAFDDTANQLRLYVDGAPAGSVAVSGSLSAIHDIDNWLGRSQYASDPELAGSLHEVRIYNAALSDALVALSFADGPDPAYLEP